MAYIKRLSANQLTLILTSLVALTIGCIFLIWLIVDSDPLRAVNLPGYELPALPESTAKREDLEAALERPLFWASRRPLDKVEETAATEQTEDSSGFTLLGTLIQGQAHAALLQTPGGVVRAQAETELPGGWSVAWVEPGKVKIFSGDRTAELEVKNKLNDAILLEKASD